MNVKQRRRPLRDQGWQRFTILASAVAGACAKDQVLGGAGVVGVLNSPRITWRKAR
jgi:hypothetical protein